MKKYLLPGVIIAVFLAGLYQALRIADWSFAGLWLTPGQQYDYFMHKNEYLKAAGCATDPMQKGTALYQAKKFEEAAAVLSAARSAEAQYNRGNSLVMLGKYDQAMTAYQDALELKPDWVEAQDNLELAQARLAKMAPPDDDFGGTGGMLGADEIVIGDRKQTPSSTENVDNTEPVDSMLNKNEQQALWLKKVQTKPADFLRLKFSYQLTKSEP
jgi:Ca-activated chloride channel family protein